MFEQWPILVGRIFRPGRNHGCCSVHTTGGSQSRGRSLLAPLTVNEKGNKELTVLRVRPAPTRFLTKVRYTSVNNILLPVGRHVVWVECQELHCSKRAHGDKAQPTKRVHAVVARLHAHEVGFVILTPETVQSPILVGGIFYRGVIRSCCLVRATKWTLFTSSLNWE